MMHVRGMRAARLPVLVFLVASSMPPARFVRRFMMLWRHRMLPEMERLVMFRWRVMRWERRLVFPCPGMLRRGSWSLVGQFMRRRVACQVRAFRCAWHIARVWRSPYQWYAAYLGCSRYDRGITGRNLTKPGCQWSDHIGSYGSIVVVFAIQVRPCLQVELLLCRQRFSHRLVSIIRVGRWQSGYVEERHRRIG